MNLVPYREAKPPIGKKQIQSDWMLCLVQTPSTRFWSIGRYDADYKKDIPWRDIYNHPLKQVTHYCELPDMPEKEKPDDYDQIEAQPLNGSDFVAVSDGVHVERVP